MSRIVQRLTANWNRRPAGVPISCVVLHATADQDTMASVEWCCTPKPANPNPVSYHVIVDRDGTLYQLVDVRYRAWHAGVSSFQGVGNVNDYSIGVSFANDNAGEPYPDVQLAVGAALIAGYMKRFNIPLDRITRHRDIALPQGRKTDPLPPAFDLAAFKVRVQRELLRAA